MATISRRQFFKAVGVNGAVLMSAPMLIDLLEACSNSPATPTQTDFRIAIESLSDQVLNPATTAPISGAWLELLYDRVIGSDKTGQPVKGGQQSQSGGVVQDWKVTSQGSGQIYTLSVRKGIKFSNGDDLTSSDIMFSLKYLTAPTSKSSTAAYLRSVIESVQAPDPQTVVITTKTPTGLLLYYLARGGDQYVLPSNYFNTHGADYFAQNPVGSGPYVVTGNQNGSYLKFQAGNQPHWFWGKPRFKNITFQLSPTESTRIASLRNKEVDLVTVSRLQASALADDSSLAIARLKAYRNIAVFYFNQWEGFLQNEGIRHALNMAIDRDSIVKTIFRGQGQQNTNLVYSPATLGYEKFGPMSPYTYDPTQAKSLLQQVGPVQLDMILSTQQGVPELQQTAQAVADMWRAVGVTVNNKQLDPATYYTAYAKGQLRNTAGVMGGNNAPVLLAQTTLLTSKGTYTVTRDPNLDQLAAQMFAAPDLNAFEQVQYQWASYVRQHDNFGPLVVADDLWAGSKALISGWNPIAIGGGGGGYLDLLAKPG